MHKRMRDVAVRHLEAIVQCPEGDTEHVADALEATTGRRVRLEHDERLVVLLRECRRRHKLFRNLLATRVR